MSDCSICLEKFDNTNVFTLDCNHTFHTKCIINWFRNKKNSCPVCRKRPENEDFFIQHSIDRFYNNFVIFNENHIPQLNMELLQNSTAQIRNSINFLNYLLLFIYDSNNRRQLRFIILKYFLIFIFQIKIQYWILLLLINISFVILIPILFISSFVFNIYNFTLENI